jgi:hypothetical protein
MQNKVYCVECCRIVSVHDAHNIFRTGFYRIVYPLGQCRECAEREPKAKQANDEAEARKAERRGGEYRPFSSKRIDLVPSTGFAG